MKINNCIILSAGFGTRMGLIGKHLPKPAWPIFEKTILELQIEFAREMGCQNIFVNTHFHHQIIEHILNKPCFSDVKILNEPNILGTGGSIHNLVATEGIRSGKLLYLAGDQFLMFDDEYFQKEMSRLTRFRAALLPIKVDSNFGYSSLEIENDLLKGIKKDSVGNDKLCLTFSGVGVVNLDDLRPVEGASSFFDSVANYEKESIYIMSRVPIFEYWDFGSFQKYYDNIYKLLSSNGRFQEFCVRHNALNLKKINSVQNSYNSEAQKQNGFINLSKSDAINNFGKESILIEGNKKTPDYLGAGIYFKDLYQKVGNSQ